MRKWRRGAALCMCSGQIKDCWSGGCRHFAPQQILQQLCAGAMTHTARLPACYRCWTRQVTRKRTKNQQPNTRPRPAPAEHAGNALLFSFCHSPFFDVTETNSDPPLRCLLMLGQFVSSFPPETSHRSHGPAGGVNPGRDHQPARSAARRPGGLFVRATGRGRLESTSESPASPMDVAQLPLGWRIDDRGAFRDPL